MSYQYDTAYYWIRAAEEYERADQATTAAAAAVHYELAYRYGIIASQADAGRPPLMLVDIEKISKGSDATSLILEDVRISAEALSAS